MAFHVHISERDETFLLTCQGLPEEQRDRLLLAAWGQLATISNEERLRPEARVKDNPQCFYHHLLFLAAGRLQTLRFVVDDSSAAMGVLRVVFVDLVEGKPIQRFT